MAVPRLSGWPLPFRQPSSPFLQPQGFSPSTIVSLLPSAKLSLRRFIVFIISVSVETNTSLKGSFHIKLCSV